MTTKLQAAFLAIIARSEFTSVNGAEPSDLADIGLIWADCVIENNTDKGVFTSLLNAGLAEHSGKGKQACVTLTQAGFDAYKAAQ
jgi:hypothetical protein